VQRRPTKLCTEILKKKKNNVGEKKNYGKITINVICRRQRDDMILIESIIVTSVE
jgi:hypothetical protein